LSSSSASPRKKVLIVGGSGFVGHHLIEAFGRATSPVDLVATGLKDVPRSAGALWRELDVTDRKAVEALLGELRPSAIIHLAALATYGASARDPDLAWRINVEGTRNVAETVLSLLPESHFLHVSSSEVYGYAANDHERLDEQVRLDPGNVYAVTKAAADLAIGELARRGLKAVRARPFNHTGRGQGDGLFVPTIAAQIARAEAGLSDPIIRIGNLDAERDFLDVRDVVLAYVSIIERFETLKPGAIFNLASGTPHRMGAILEALVQKASIPIGVEQDPARMRPSEVQRICGDARAIHKALGWAPHYSLDETLETVLEDWRQRVHGGKGAS